MARHKKKRSRSRGLSTRGITGAVSRRALQRFGSQAQLEAGIKFGPEESALRELVRQARSGYLTDVRIERGTAKSIQAAASRARPELQQVYARATGDHQAANQALGADLNALGGAADRFKAGAAREAAGAARRLAESGASALRGLEERKQNAVQGEAQGIRQARSRYESDKGTALRRQQSLAGEKGSFMVATINNLQDADRKYRTQIRQQNIALRGQDLSNRQKSADRRQRSRSQSRDRSLRREDIGLKRKTTAETRRHNQAQERAATQRARRTGGGGRGGAKGVTTAVKRSAQEKFGRAHAIASSSVTLKKRGRTYENQMVNFLVIKKSIPSPLAKAAVQTVIYGGAGPGTAKVVRQRYGIRLRRF